MELIENIKRANLDKKIMEIKEMIKLYEQKVDNLNAQLDDLLKKRGFV